MDSKILIVDDASFMRMMIKDVLTKNGYSNLLEASDGEIAVKTYKNDNPVLVIMDITMPNMDGIQALKVIKEHDKNAKIIMCSAMGQETMVMDAVKSGALDFIVKPFKPERIIQAVQKALNS